MMITISIKMLIKEMKVKKFQPYKVATKCLIEVVSKALFLLSTPKSPSLAPPKRLREGAGGTY
jgi:hypothetical protein